MRIQVEIRRIYFYSRNARYKQFKFSACESHTGAELRVINRISWKAQPLSRRGGIGFRIIIVIIIVVIIIVTIPQESPVISISVISINQLRT